MDEQAARHVVYLVRKEGLGALRVRVSDKEERRLHIAYADYRVCEESEYRATVARLARRPFDMEVVAYGVEGRQ